MYNFTEPANCYGLDTEMFFTETDKSKSYTQKEYISKVCSNCKARPECLEYAVTHEVLGWWGGTSEKQRDAMRRARNITPISIFSGY